MPIYSKARAMEAAERAAERYRLTVDVVLCARWDRAALAARADLAAELAAEPLSWSTRAIGRFLGCSHTRVRKLLGFQKTQAAWRGLDPGIDLGALVVLNRDEQARRLAEAETRARDLQRQMDRLSGAHLAETLATAFGMPLRCGIVLAVLAEHYPRPVRAQALFDFYDHACAVIGYGMRSGANAELIKKNISSLNQAFAALSLPAPVENDPVTGQRRLSHAVAKLLHERHQTPRRSQMLAANEASVPRQFTAVAS